VNSEQQTVNSGQCTLNSLAALPSDMRKRFAFRLATQTTSAALPPHSAERLRLSDACAYFLRRRLMNRRRSLR